MVRLILLYTHHMALSQYNESAKICRPKMSTWFNLSRLKKGPNVVLSRFLHCYGTRYCSAQPTLRTYCLLVGVLFKLGRKQIDDKQFRKQ